MAKSKDNKGRANMKLQGGQRATLLRACGQDALHLQLARKGWLSNTVVNARDRDGPA